MNDVTNAHRPESLPARQNLRWHQYEAETRRRPSLLYRRSFPTSSSLAARDSDLPDPDGGHSSDGHASNDCKNAQCFHATGSVRFFLDMLEMVEQNENMGREIASREPLTLSEPACEIGCRTCLMSCAILPARLAWWERELERLYRERSLSWSSDELRGQIESALAAHEALARRYAASPRAASASSLRRRSPRQSSAPGRLH